MAPVDHDPDVPGAVSMHPDLAVHQLAPESEIDQSRDDPPGVFPAPLASPDGRLQPDGRDSTREMDFQTADPSSGLMARHNSSIFAGRSLRTPLLPATS